MLEVQRDPRTNGRGSLVGMATGPHVNDTSTSWRIGANIGPSLRMRWHWRRPRFPFSPPVCHDRFAVLIWSTEDTWRCPVCATRIWPERLHHRLMLRRNPFRPGESKGFRQIFQVYRAEGYPERGYILGRMKSFLVKVPEGMLERWRESAVARHMNLSQMIREAVNKDIDASESREKKGK